MPESRSRVLLCVANFPSGTGYAWDFIESLYAGVADRLSSRGIHTVVAYPGLSMPVRTLEGSTATAIDRAVRLSTPAGVLRACALVREVGASVLYLADRPAWHPGYAALRAAGLRRVVVHDHTSGARTRPTGLRRWTKKVRTHVPGTLADRVLAVSDFVARRKTEVDLVPPDRVERIWNSIVIDPEQADDDVASGRAALCAELQLAPGRPIVLCACRASESKGVHHLLRSFDAVWAGTPGAERPVLVYAGEGPALETLAALRDGLPAREDIHLLGYRSDITALIDAACVCVVPSVWEEAFGLAALEPMARGRAVIASRGGGLPEVVVEGETGLLVPPGDEAALARALHIALADPTARDRWGRAGRVRAVELFGRERQLDALARVLGECFP